MPSSFYGNTVNLIIIDSKVDGGSWLSSDWGLIFTENCHIYSQLAWPIWQISCPRKSRIFPALRNHRGMSAAPPQPPPPPETPRPPPTKPPRFCWTVFPIFTTWPCILQLVVLRPSCTDLTGSQRRKSFYFSREWKSSRHSCFVLKRFIGICNQFKIYWYR